jgi:phage-related baseplate assembly protein
VQTFRVGDFTKFRRIDLRDSNLTEILSVVDTAGREYFEVDYLSQNIIYRPVANTGANSNTVSNLLKPFVAMRRFVVEREFGRNFLQFGYGSEDNLSNEGFLNPDDVALERHARNYITDRSFDPTKMLQSDKFGVSPSNTTLRVSYRTNDSTTVNAAVGTVIRVENSIFKFSNTNKLNNGLKNKVINSLEVTNDDPVVGGVTFPSTDEIKRRIFDVFTSQHRAVTAQDYKALIYMMPSKFGSIKRCNILQDPDAMKRNLNISVVSEDSNGNLAKTNDTIKNNLKNWLNQYRMVNDTIDILDARIVNIGINFTIVSQGESNKHTVLRRAENALRKHFMSIGDISEAVSISDIYRILNQISGVSDTADVTMVRKSGGAYSAIGFNIEEHMSFDGRYLIAPEDVIYEIRFLDTDIEGTVR